MSTNTLSTRSQNTAVPTTTPAINSTAYVLGDAYIKCMTSTQVFATSLSSSPRVLDQAHGGVRSVIDCSNEAKKSYGEAHLADGPLGAYRALKGRCGMVLQGDLWVTFLDRYSQSLTTRQPLPTYEPECTIDDMALIQSTIGYEFTNQQLLIDALSLRTLESERLEFVGDAALDVVSASYWVNKYPTAGRRIIAKLKSASTCNQFLSMVYIDLGLHQWVNCNSFVRESFTKAGTLHWVALAEDPTWDFWLEVDYPKSLADAFEALLGAVYVDSGFDTETVADVFETCLRPTVERYITIESIRTASELVLVKYCPHLQFHDSSLGQDGEISHQCTVMLGETVLAEATNTRAQLAKRVACRIILERLRSDPSELATVCNCFAQG